jgi:hypothetical protein
MPVIAAEEGGCELARRRHVGVTVHGMADLIGILLVHAGERKVGEAFGGVNIEGVSGRGRLGSGARNEQQY